MQRLLHASGDLCIAFSILAFSVQSRSDCQLLIQIALLFSDANHDYCLYHKSYEIYYNRILLLIYCTAQSSSLLLYAKTNRATSIRIQLSFVFLPIIRDIDRIQLMRAAALCSTLSSGMDAYGFQISIATMFFLSHFHV